MLYFCTRVRYVDKYKYFQVQTCVQMSSTRRTKKLYTSCYRNKYRIAYYKNMHMVVVISGRSLDSDGTVVTNPFSDRFVIIVK